MSSLSRKLIVTTLTAALTLGFAPTAFAEPADARSEEGRSARSLYVPGLDGGLPGMVESGDASRRQTLVEAARSAELGGGTYGADASDHDGLGGISEEIDRQEDLRDERAARLAAERAERERQEADEAAARAAAEAAEKKAAEEQAAAERAAREATQQTAVDTALAQVGKPYRWGGSGPHAFDCSGLTSYAWAAAGVELPRTSRAQYQATTRVSSDDLQPGDLLFFYSPVSHVGMYIGDGKMVDAPSSGRSVRVRSVFSSGFVGAGRPSY